MKKKVSLQKIGIKRMTRRKNKNTLTQKERYAKRKKANEEFQAWFK